MHLKAWGCVYWPFFFFYLFGRVMSIFILLTSLKRVFSCEDHSQLFLDLYISFRDQNIRIWGIEVKSLTFFLWSWESFYTFCAWFSSFVKWVAWHPAQPLMQVTTTGTDSNIISAGWEATEENEDESDRHPSYSGSDIDDDEDFISSTSKNNQFL